jgi:four helix bundle protein
MFPHEKLSVYGKALEFVADASACAARWDKRHAVVDQFGRASDSLVLKLAEGARLRPGRAKLRALDFALGSCLECAACLDIAWEKGFLETMVTPHHKRRLCEVAKMLVGLGKIWETWRE